jgi:type I restriction enzyme M protein
MATGKTQKSADGSNLDFEAQLWAAADKMRGHMDASEYKHVCLGLIFLKYISDAFEEKREQLLFGFSDPKSEWFIKDEPQRADVTSLFRATPVSLGHKKGPDDERQTVYDGR